MTNYFGSIITRIEDEFGPISPLNKVMLDVDMSDLNIGGKIDSASNMYSKKESLDLSFTNGKLWYQLSQHVLTICDMHKVNVDEIEVELYNDVIFPVWDDYGHIDYFESAQREDVNGEPVHLYDPEWIEYEVSYAHPEAECPNKITILNRVVVHR